MNPRLLWAALALCLLASLWLATIDDEPVAAVVQATTRPAQRTAAAAAAPRPRTDAAASIAVSTDSAWRLQAWPDIAAAARAGFGLTPAAATVVARATAADAEPAAAAPARPEAPPFPYRWIGRLDDGAAPIALLASNERSLGARAGDVLDAQWRVDSIAATSLQLTWLPGGDVIAVRDR